MLDAMQSITANLAKQGSGYAAIIDGVLNVRTVSDSEKGTALNALWAVGFYVQGNCQDPDCDCTIRLLQKARPDIRIVPVNVGVSA